MKNIYFGLLFTICALGATSALAQENFFQNLPDIPIPNGAQESPGSSTIFETPQGRIVEAQAFLCALPPESAQRFYADTLPALGWQRTAENQYRRDDERLSITQASTAPRDGDHGSCPYTITLLVQPISSSR